MKRNLIIAITVVLFSGFLVWAADKTSINGDNIALPDVATENPTAKANCLNKPDVYYGPNEGATGVPWELRGSETPGTDVYESTYTSTFPGVHNWKENSSSPDDPALGTRNVRMGTDGRIYIKDNSEIENGTALRAGGGVETYYVDYTDGTDDSEHGLLADSGAWKTIAYAMTRIPLDASSVTVNLSTETHTLASSAVLSYRNGIAFTGGWSDVTAELSLDSGVQGATSTQGSVVDTGALSVTASSTVDETTAAAANHIHVAATTNFTVGGTIVIGAGTVREEVHIVKSISAGDYLGIEGILEYEHTSGDADAVVQGGYSGKYIKFESDTTTTALRGDYRLIDWNDLNTLTIVGYFDAQPQSGDTYKIVDPGAIIDGGASGYSVQIIKCRGISFNYVAITNDHASNPAMVTGEAYVTLTGSAVDGNISIYPRSTLYSYYSRFTPHGKTSSTIVAVSNYGMLYLTASLIRGPATTGIFNYMGYVNFPTSPSIIDSCATLVSATRPGYVTFASLYNRLRGGSTLGVYANKGAQIQYTTNNIYLGNTTDESYDAATGSYGD